MPENKINENKYDKLSDELMQRILEDRNEHRINPYATKNEDYIRREMDHDKPVMWRPNFVRDTEKIIHIPFYNRYMDKTQVFSLCKNDDVSRRALHVQLVSRIARNIGSLLNLNCDLIEAIALGHDIGHTPFGHQGEHKLSELYYERTGRYFNHNIHSARVLDTVFPLNLTIQTLDGIICHNGEMECKEYRPCDYKDFATFDRKLESCYLDKTAIRELTPMTLEGCVVRVSDIIAYLGKDRQDALKLGVIDKNSAFNYKRLGDKNAAIINNMIVNIVENSYGKPYISMDEDIYDDFKTAKSENYSLIYLNDGMADVYTNVLFPMFEKMYEKLLRDAIDRDRNSVLYVHHIDYINSLTSSYRRLNNYLEEEPNDLVVDYMASMTDDYFVELYDYLFPNDKTIVKYKGYFDNL